MVRTHTCGELREKHIGERATLCGWVSAARDHGGVIFIDLRDHYGITQAVLHDIAVPAKESAVICSGYVKARDAEAVNPNMKTGTVELHADSLTIVGSARNILPFEVETSMSVKEETRLKYRFLDLRNNEMHRVITLRSEIFKFIRKQMDELAFVEVNTPILTASSPEGARDYIVPSRIHPGKFYALPQAPQQFKQLLMVSGFDRYYQLAPCFRDEDPRQDRLCGDFYQLDLEMAFAEQDDVFKIAETVFTNLFTKFAQKPINPVPFRRIPYFESMLKYGTDKPDLRNPLIISDLTDFFSDVEFNAFKGKPVRGIVAPVTGQSRAFYDSMVKYAQESGMMGLGYLNRNDGTFKGPIEKFLSSDKQAELVARLGIKDGDAVFFISDKSGVIDKLSGKIRTELAVRLNLIQDDRYEFCFIVDFPMYEENEETGALEFTHNPFCMPQGEPSADVLAYQYDVVCNGEEITSGAVRNHDPEVMKKVFALAGYSEDELARRFGALFSAFHYGAPPHAGMGAGIERIIMLLTGAASVRDVVPFPLTGSASDPLFGAPVTVSEQQLREAHIKLR